MVSDSIEVEDFDCPMCGSDNLEYSFPLVDDVPTEKAICRICCYEWLVDDVDT